MSDPYKLRAMALLVAAGFIGGLFAQYQAPGKFMPPPRHAKQKKHQLVAEGEMEDDDEGDPQVVPLGGASKDSEASAAARAAEERARAEAEQAAKKEAEEKAAAEAKRQAELLVHTPEVQSKYAAIAAVLDNTIQVKTADGVVTYYFSPRGLSAEIEGDRATVRIWRREEDRLCQQLDADNRECFKLVVRLDTALQKGPANQIRNRIEAMAVGAHIGVVEGAGGAAELVRGNVAKFPSYVPLMDPHPNQLGPKAEPILPGALLTNARDGETSAATYFAPTGQLLEVTREQGTSEIVRMWTGSWRWSGDTMCRDLPTGGGGRAGQECSRVRIAGRSFEFPDAAASRRSYQRILGADEARNAEEEAAAEAEAKESADELERQQIEARARAREKLRQREKAMVTLAPSTDSGSLELGRQRSSSFTDLR